LAITFEELGLEEELLKALNKLNFSQATPIQEKSIPFLLEKENDLIALAQTGTGKTAAFSLPILQRCNPKDSSTQAMILSPTRELCLQICNDIAAFSKYMPNLSVLAVYGGSSISEQIRALKSGAQIVVGTPGRTVDLINRKKLDLSNINYLVLDEADEMLSMGFQDSLNAILEVTSQNRQTVLFSATMPNEIRKISKKYMNDPHEISVVTDNKSASNVSHEYYVTYEKNRYEVLKRLADFNPNIYSIVFCRTRLETQKIADKLIQDGYSAESIHGDLSQAQRDMVMKKFRKKKVQMLVATDVAARGIDVDDLTHVINYNLPDSLEAYVHRSGRTGRADKKGVCITIINARENGRIRQVEKKIGRKFDLNTVPSGEEVCAIRMMKLIDNVRNVKVDENEINPFIEQINSSLEDLSREELIKKFVSVEFNRFLDYYKNAGDLNATPSKSRGGDREKGRRKDKGKRRDGNYSRFFINIGKMQNLSPKELIVLINKTMKGRTFGIGEIDLQKNFSFFEVDKGMDDEVIRRFRGSKYKGMKINVELANPKGSRPKRKKSHRKGQGKKRK
jgi:ATP-dependent RNA helicase DeaD